MTSLIRWAALGHPLISLWPWLPESLLLRGGLRSSPYFLLGLQCSSFPFTVLFIICFWLCSTHVIVFFFIMANIHNKIDYFNHFLSVHFIGIKYIHIVADPSPPSLSTTFSSCKLKVCIHQTLTPHSLPHCPLCPWQPPFCFPVYEFDYPRDFI